MTSADNVWTLERHAAAPAFSQRFTGTFGHDRNMIVGRWESSGDGSNWNPTSISPTRARNSVTSPPAQRGDTQHM